MFHITLLKKAEGFCAEARAHFLEVSKILDFFVLLQVVGEMIQFDLRIFVRNGVVQPPTTLRETDSSPPKIDGWKMNFLFRRPSGRGYVSFKGCILFSGTFAVSFRVIPFPTEFPQLPGC